MIDAVAQICIAILGTSAIALTALWKNRWGCVLGLAGQPFWITTAIANRQPGVLAITAIYTTLWASATYKNFAWPQRGGDSVEDQPTGPCEPTGQTSAGISVDPPNPMHQKKKGTPVKIQIGRYTVRTGVRTETSPDVRRTVIGPCRICGKPWWHPNGHQACKTKPSQ